MLYVLYFSYHILHYILKSLGFYVMLVSYQHHFTDLHDINESLFSSTANYSE